MNDKDIEGAISWIIDFISQIANAVMAALDLLPPVVLGSIAIIIFLAFLWRWARGNG